ncbi:AIPR family protein [Paracoccus laeviglucosivorans]|uniref:AIPR protein n=1 Tax=Paracoccus laeviglucosivorans TaxID=1197861 RepID=A0A521FPG9_9RHOB|nr:AIPR family protein [Paracoccus laeviglucosivorans]SMO98105.1 AIPR protein [Paracoccus laeviglucosivorans]
MRTFNEEEFNRLNERIDQLLSSQEIQQRSQALIHIFLTHRFYCEKVTIDEVWTDGGNDCGIDAIHIDRRGDEPVIHLLQSKVFDSTRKASNPFPFSSAEKTLRFFEILKDRRCDLKKVVNPKLEQKILEIRDIIAREFPSFKLWLLGNGMPCSTIQIAPCIKSLEREDVQVEEFHLDEIVEFCLNTHSGRVNHVFYARDVGVLESGNSELRSVVGYVSGLELYKLLRDMRDERKIDYTLFNMNVRGFLGLDNPVNKEIFRTAVSGDNINFASLNNGITIVGSQCRVNRTGSDMPKIGIKRMSIVNGAQTCSAIFDAIKDYYPDTSKFEKLSVLFRVFETEDPDLISRIAVSTNNQSRINPRDLRANDDIQRRLERELRSYGISYRRKRGFQPEGLEESKQLDALKAGQILLSYVHHDPVKSKRESDVIFTDLYAKVFGGVDVAQLVEALSWYEIIEERRRIVQDDLRIRGQRRTENTFLTYGAFHVLMLCNLLGPGVAEQERGQIVDQAVKIISDHIIEAGNPAHYAFFRDAKQSEAMRTAAVEPKLL